MYFGMKAHVGVDSNTTIIHRAVATAANVADSAVLPDLLHAKETRVGGRLGLSRTERSDPGVLTAGSELYPSALPLQGSY
jgi:IS5 family transposase